MPKRKTLLTGLDRQVSGMNIESCDVVSIALSPLPPELQSAIYLTPESYMFHFVLSRLNGRHARACTHSTYKLYARVWNNKCFVRAKIYEHGTCGWHDANVRWNYGRLHTHKAWSVLSQAAVILGLSVILGCVTYTNEQLLYRV